MCRYICEISVTHVLNHILYLIVQVNILLQAINLGNISFRDGI